MLCFGWPGNRKGMWVAVAVCGVVCAAAWAPASRAAGTAVGGQLTSPLRTLLHAQTHGYLGVDVADVTPASEPTLRVSGGAVITMLDHDAPAGKAGLRVDDVIVAANGARIANAEQFRKLLLHAQSGKKLRLQVSRAGAVKAISVQLEDRRKVEQEARQEMAQSAMPPMAQGFLGGDDAPKMGGGFHFWSLGSSFHVGALVEPMTPEMLDYVGVSNGVMVKSVARRSAAARAGLRAHDVILMVGEDAVATTSDWERLLRTSQGRVVPIAIVRARSRETLWLQLRER